MTGDTIATHPHAVACWADPLSREERREVAAFLARACKRFWDAAPPLFDRAHGRTGATLDLGYGLVAASAECSDLHLDVTERAAFVPHKPKEG